MRVFVYVCVPVEDIYIYILLEETKQWFFV